MSLKIIAGPAGSGKTYTLLSEIIAESLRYPDKSFIVVVPEQVSMITQETLCAMHPGGTILNIDVLSFERLSYRVFEELGFLRKERLDETGKTFILQKIILDLENSLPALGRRLKAPGSAAAMKSVISEFMQYGIGKEDLEAAAEATRDRLLKAKLLDIARIYDVYRERLSERFITAEEVPVLLSEIVDDSELIRGSVIAFDGFTGFTPVQERLVQRLMALAERVLVTVACDADLPLNANPDENPLFSLSIRMLKSLWSMAGEENVRLEPEVRLGEAGGSFGNLPRFQNSSGLGFLEKQIFRRFPAVCPADNLHDIFLTAYSDPSSEAEGVARQIAGLVRVNGWRYRDIAVICGDLSASAPSLKRAFTEEDIPFFIDLKRPLPGNPFVEYLRAGVEACVDGYSYDSVFRCLKTGMTGLTADEIDRLENYVLGAGIRSKRAWRTPWTRPVRGESPPEIDALNRSREKVASLLDPLSDALAERGATVRSRTAALYRFGAVSRCQEKLKGRQEAFEADGRLDLAREYAQIYGKVMALYDRFVDLLGNETMPMADYQALLEAGLMEIRIGLVPPGTDQVMVGDVERSRLKAVKAVFFVGVNEGAVPKTDSAASFLTEADRLRLKEGGMTLRPLPREEADIQNFYLYLALTKPSEKLFLSYVMADAAGSAARPSTLISQIRRLFPGLKVRTGDLSGVSCLERPAEGLRLLAGSIRQTGEKEQADSWYELYGWFRRHTAYTKRVAALLKGAAFRMTEDVISREAVKKLYGATIRGSATRLELYAACPFRFFAQYGLRLRERDVFALSGLDRGNVIHEALERFGTVTKRERLTWAELPDEALSELADRCLGAAVADRFIFADSARNAYEVERLRRAMRRAVWAIREQLKAGDFAPYSLEESFADELLQSSHFALADGSQMILTGKIDRIDTCDDGAVRYVKVIDYKTGEAEFSLTKLYHGLQLQLALYMNAALEIAATDGKTPVPAGFFYHKVADPMLKIEDIGATDPEDKLLGELKEKGIIGLEPEIYRHFDRSLAPGRASLVAPIRLKNDGGPYQGTIAGYRETFEVIGTFANRKAAQIGNRILSGYAAASPYRIGTSENGCTYCPYRGVCGFDDRLAGCDFREIRKIGNEDAILMMREDNELDN